MSASDGNAVEREPGHVRVSHGISQSDSNLPFANLAMSKVNLGSSSSLCSAGSSEVRVDEVSVVSLEDEQRLSKSVIQRCFGEGATATPNIDTESSGRYQPPYGQSFSHYSNDSGLAESSCSGLSRDPSGLGSGPLGSTPLDGDAGGLLAGEEGSLYQEEFELSVPYYTRSAVTLFVRVPAYVALGQKGRGKILKCTFSPFSLVKAVRNTIIEKIQSELILSSTDGFRLCRQIDDGSWQWLDEERNLAMHNIHAEAHLELKENEPLFRDVSINIPQLDRQVTLEYDQFSLVQDVLEEVLRLHEVLLDSRSTSYALYHVRHKTRLSLTESMVFYELLPTDFLECKMIQGRAKMIVVTVEIPEAKSQRKVRASLDQTVGDLISTLIRRLTDINDRAWQYFALYLRPRPGRRVRGVWMEEYKFLSTYNLDEQDVLEYRPKYRLFTFNMRIYPAKPELALQVKAAGSNTVEGGSVQTPKMLVDETTTVKQVIELLSSSCDLDYPPSWYRLYDLTGTELVSDQPLWELVAPSEHGTVLTVHMKHSTIYATQQGEESEGTLQLSIDLSWPTEKLRDLLCRRFGVRYPSLTGIFYKGNFLPPKVSLLKSSIEEGDTLTLAALPVDSNGHVPAEWEGAASSPSICSEEFEPSSYDTLDSLSVRSSVLSDDVNDPNAFLRQKAIPSNLSEARGVKSRTSYLYLRETDDRPFWDEEPDSEKNIRFQTENKKTMVVGASFNKLVEQLTHSERTDMEYVHTFLTTYRNFTKPEKLFSKLLERYCVVRQEKMTFPDFNIFRTKIQSRTINAVRLWLDTGDDFRDNQKLQQDILEFIEDIVMMDWPQLVGPLRQRLNEIQHGVFHKVHRVSTVQPAPPPKLPMQTSLKLSLFAFDPEEIARQMTLIDFKLYEAIRPHEFLNQAWLKPKLKHRAQNLQAMIDRMNKVTLWVATHVLSQKDKYGRAKRMTEFVQVAEQLHKMDNYCTLMAVLSGLQHSSILRLRKTFDKIEKKTMKRLNELQDLFAPGNSNFRVLRKEQGDAVPPVMPYIGIFMADLTFIDNGNDNFSSGLINFTKCRLIYSQISQIKAAQSTPYNFEKIPSISDLLTKLHYLEEEALTGVSLQREPRS